MYCKETMLVNYQEQYNLRIIKQMDNKIIGLYIIDETKYMYNVIEDKKEFWYMMDGDRFKKMNIISNREVGEDNMVYKFKVKNKVFRFEQKGDRLYIGNKMFKHSNDKYLYDLFYDIKRMNQ